MKRASIAVLFAVLLAACVAISIPSRAADEKHPDNTPPEGFMALFNGKDLTNWKGLMAQPLDNPYTREKLSPAERKRAQAVADKSMKEHWKAEDGVLVFDGQGQSLATAKDYANFEMYVDWKIGPLGDSGIYLRGCPQVQIWDPKDGPAGGTGSGGLYNNKKNPSKPTKVADKPIGEWNTFWIKMVGDKVWVKLNDELVVDGVVMENYWARDMSKLGDLPIFPSGQIELQNHSHPLYFKNIYIKELPATESK